ncbi:MAG: hypothetical protein C0425_01745 [Chlorobiaceae bacterium]|nr:hypothetical protein [Chlorobiaceae bacterium]MBA4309042.1 hypothetical protein [Chlorobiaceae bacterium]
MKYQIKSKNCLNKLKLKTVNTQYCVITDVVRQCKKTRPANGTFGFLPTHKPKLKKPKEPFFAIALTD